MQALTDVFKGLADPNRLRILNLLLHGELCGCDIQFVMETSQPNISRHLIYLKNCGLVRDRRAGFRVFYSLADDRPELLKALFRFLRDAFRSEETFERDTAKLKKAIESGSCSVDEWRPYSAVGSPRSTSARV
jgi:ArsR family transcriptional regulator